MIFIGLLRLELGAQIAIDWDLKNNKKLPYFAIASVAETCDQKQNASSKLETENNQLSSLCCCI